MAAAAGQRFVGVARTSSDLTTEPWRRMKRFAFGSRAELDFRYYQTAVATVVNIQVNRVARKRNLITRFRKARSPGQWPDCEKLLFWQIDFLLESRLTVPTFDRKAITRFPTSQ